jgi:anti-sigma regulatory factor (Ser/Thr protein kinase)
MELDTASQPQPPRFRHEALVYEGTEDFVDRTAGYVREGLDAQEAVLVAVATAKARALRGELGPDAREVEFVDIESLGRNPARIIPAWQDWVDRNTAWPRAFRGIGELVWAGRNPIEIREYQTHEHLLNAAFGAGPAWSLLCPYDALGLPAEVVEHVSGSHPTVLGRHDGDSRQRPAYDATGAERAFAAPLPDLGTPVAQLLFGLADLARLRTLIRELAPRLALVGRRLADFLLVADELASNSILHGGGKGRFRVWRHGAHAICEVCDNGVITDPLVGRRRPDIRTQDGGAGLWSANQLADLLLIHSTPSSGTTVRAYVDVEPVLSGLRTPDDG